MGEKRSTTSDRTRTSACSGTEGPATAPFQPSASAVARWALIAASNPVLPAQSR